MALLRFVLAASVSLIRRRRTTPSPSVRAQNQQPTFRAGTTLVEVDVIVRDGKPQFVADLRPEDFEVLRRRRAAGSVGVLPGGRPGRTAATAGRRRRRPCAAPAAAAGPARAGLLLRSTSHPARRLRPRPQGGARSSSRRTFARETWAACVVNGKMVNDRLTSNREELSAALKTAKPEAAASVTRELREWPRFVDIMEAYRVTRRAPGCNPGPTVLDDVVERACRERPDDCRGPGRAAVEAQVEAQGHPARGERADRVQAGPRQPSLRSPTAWRGCPAARRSSCSRRGSSSRTHLSDLQVVVGRAAQGVGAHLRPRHARAESRLGEQRHPLAARAPSQPGTVGAVHRRLGRRRPEQPRRGHRRLRHPQRERLRQGVHRDRPRHQFVLHRRLQDVEAARREVPRADRPREAERRDGPRAEGLRRVDGAPSPDADARDAGRRGRQAVRRPPDLADRARRTAGAAAGATPVPRSHRPQERRRPKPRRRRRPPSAPRRAAPRRSSTIGGGVVSPRSRCGAARRSSGSRRRPAGRRTSGAT